MFKIILDWLTGGIVKQFTDPLLQAQKQYLEAEGDSEKLIAEQNLKLIEADIEQKNNQKEIRLATAGFWEMRLLTVLIALPFIIHLWIVAWDTWDTSVNWRIPSFPEPFDEWQGLILLSFFGVTVVGSGIKSIAGAWAYKKK